MSGPAGEITAAGATLNGHDRRKDGTHPNPLDRLRGWGGRTGTVYHFAACAEDSDNGGEAFCSPDKTFRTLFDIQLTLTADCVSWYPPDHGLYAEVTGLTPRGQFLGELDDPAGGTTGWTRLTADENGAYNSGTFFGSAVGTWTGSVEFEGQTVTESKYVDCGGARRQR
jgi:hypothetical protein